MNCLIKNKIMKTKQILFYLFWWTYLRRRKNASIYPCERCPFNNVSDCGHNDHVSLYVNCNHGFIRRFL